MSKVERVRKFGLRTTSKTIKKKAKEQATVEYLSIYGWALLIIAAVLAFVLIYVSLPQSIAPSHCAISLGFDCNAVVFGTNVTTQNITIAMAITNRLSQPIESPNLTITYDGTNYTGSCSPAYLPPGASSVCEFKIPQKARLGDYVSSPIYITAKNCGLAVNSSCASAPKEVFAGNMQAHATTYVSPNVSLTLSANTTSPIQGHKVKITAYVTLLGYPIGGGVVNFTVNNPNFTMSPQSALTSSGYAYSNLFGVGIGTVKVTGTYASVSKNLTFTFTKAPTTPTTISTITSTITSTTTSTTTPTTISISPTTPTTTSTSTSTTTVSPSSSSVQITKSGNCPTGNILATCSGTSCSVGGTGGGSNSSDEGSRNWISGSGTENYNGSTGSAVAGCYLTVAPGDICTASNTVTVSGTVFTLNIAGSWTSPLHNCRIQVSIS